MKDFNVLIDGKNLFYMPIKNEEQKYKQITEMGRKNDYRQGRQFTGLRVHFKTLQIDLNRFKWANWISEPWFKAAN